MSHAVNARPARPTDLADYRGYQGLPALAGVSSMADGVDVGLSVGESVSRLKRHHWMLRRLHEVLMHRLASVPVYELKMAFSLHAHYAAEHAASIRTRIREMREPPYGLDDSPDAKLDVLFDELKSAPGVAALVLGLYEVLVPALADAVAAHGRETSRLFDHPTVRLLRFAGLELAEVREYGEAAVAALVGDDDRRGLGAWADLLRACLDESGDAAALAPVFSGGGYEYDPVPQRDERFVDPYNMGVAAERLLFDERADPRAKVLVMYFKRLREIDVPEMMSSILAEKPVKDWEYVREMTRQLWDEARHAMMGEIGFVASGVDWTAVPVPLVWSLVLNTKMGVRDRHAVLFAIEQGLMPAKTGKQYEWETAVAAADDLAARVQDYDWADEVLHARIGRDWIVPELGGQKEAMRVGQEAFAGVNANADAWRRQGLTRHENWWPRVYREACAAAGVEPDPYTLAFDHAYGQPDPADAPDAPGSPVAGATGAGATAAVVAVGAGVGQ